MPPQAHEGIARRFVDEVLNGRDMDAVDGFFAMAYWPGSLKRGLAETLAMFPDAAYSLDGMIANEEGVAFHITMRGSHTGDAEGLKPTGIPVQVISMYMFWVTDGKITRVLQLKDNDGLMTQLGFRLQPPEDPS
jgi:predicted ester cyclase